VERYTKCFNHSDDLIGLEIDCRCYAPGGLMWGIIYYLNKLNIFLKHNQFLNAEINI